MTDSNCVHQTATCGFDTVAAIDTVAFDTLETLGVAYNKYTATTPGSIHAAASARFTGAPARPERELVGFREESGSRSSADCKDSEPRPSEGGTRAGA